MVKKTEVVMGDIICLHDRAFEIKEIHKNSVEGIFMPVPLGYYTESWAKTKPFYLTADLLSTIGFEEVEDSGGNLWLYKGDYFKIHYNIQASSLSILRNPIKAAGFAYCYINTLHELMHQFSTYNIETVHIYRQMQNYRLPFPKSEV